MLKPKKRPRSDWEVTPEFEYELIKEWCVVIALHREACADSKCQVCSYYETVRDLIFGIFD